MQMKSSRSSMNELLTKIKTWIHDVFNRDFFSLYEGVVESYDAINSIVAVRIPELSDIHIADCRYAFPARGMKLPLRSGDHVIIGFLSFDISRPVVFGYLPATDVPEAFIENTVVFENGSSKITITNNAITLESGSITANGEDLTYDDEGSM